MQSILKKSEQVKDKRRGRPEQTQPVAKEQSLKVTSLRNKDLTQSREVLPQDWSRVQPVSVQVIRQPASDKRKDHRIH